LRRRGLLLLAHRADETYTLAGQGTDKTLFLSRIVDRVSGRRVLNAESDTIRPSQIEANKSSLLTTRSRLRIKYSRRSKTWGAIETSFGPRRSSRRSISRAKSLKRYSNFTVSAPKPLSATTLAHR
jgi:hypothetical protein